MYEKSYFFSVREEKKIESDYIYFWKNSDPGPNSLSDPILFFILEGIDTGELKAEANYSVATFFRFSREKKTEHG